MIRLLVTPFLIFAVLFQTVSPLVCTALLMREQAGKAGHGCCRSSGSPFKTPAGMPDDQCCFKRGPLLAKAMVPEAEAPPSVDVLALPPFVPEGGTVGADEHGTLRRIDGPLRSPPPTQPLLQIFRI